MEEDSGVDLEDSGAGQEDSDTVLEGSGPVPVESEAVMEGSAVVATVEITEAVTEGAMEETTMGLPCRTSLVTPLKIPRGPMDTASNQTDVECRDTT